MTYGLSYFMRYINAKLSCGKRLSIPLRTRLGKMTDIYCKTGYVSIGNYSSVRENVHLSALCDGKLTMGENVRINRNCIFVSRKHIEIGDNVSFGPNVCIYDHDHCFGAEGRKEGFTLGDVFIGDNCWIGAGCIILKNTHIGKGCVIGAGCVIKGNIPDHSLVTMGRNLNIVPLEERSNE